MSAQSETLQFHTFDIRTEVENAPSRPYRYENHNDGIIYQDEHTFIDNVEKSLMEAKQADAAAAAVASVDDDDAQINGLVDASSEPLYTKELQNGKQGISASE